MNETLKVLQTAKIENTDPKYDTLKKELTDIETNLDAKKVSETDQIKVLGDFLNFMQSTEDANAIATKKKEILEMKDQVETTNLKNNVEKQNYYSYFDMVQQNPTLSASIEAQLKAKGNTETLQERCDKIDGVWSSFIEGAVETKFPPETLKSMSTGLSIYLTDRLNKSGLNTDEIAKNATGLTEGGIGGVVGKMFKLFGNMSGFSEIMNTVNGAAKVINTHSSSILIQDAQGKEAVNPSCSAVFNTPHGFYDWMKNSIAIKQPSNTNLTFDQIFTQFQGTSTQEIVRSQVIDKQNYTAGVHNLMDKVIHEGKSVLALRNSSKNTVEGVFDAIQSQLDSLQGTLSQLGINISSIGDALDSVGLKGVGDFVCMLLGYGSVQGLEKKNRSKKFDKDMTPEEKAALNQVVAYASKFMNDKSYTPTTHDDSNSFLNQSGLKSTIDGYNKDNKKPINLTLFPTSPTLIVDSFRSGLSDGKTFPDPTICQEIPELSGYVVMTTGKDGIQIPVIDGSKTKEFVDKLQDKTIIEKLVASSIAKSQDLSFLAKFSETKTNEPAKTPSDYIGLLFTTCLAPTTAANAWKFDVVDRKSLGKGVNSELIGTGAQNAAIESKKSLESELATKKKEKEDIEAQIKEVKENKDKLSQTELTLKADTLLKKKSDIDNDIAKKEKQLQEINTVNIPVVATSTPAPETKNTTNDTNKNNIESLPTNEKAKYCYNRYISKGLPPIVAAAIVGNIQVESGFSTTIIGDKNLSDPAEGLCQRRDPRLENGKEYAKQQGKKREDMDTQLDFVLVEPGESHIIDKLKKCTSVEEATTLFCEKYERPGIPHLEKRIAAAKAVFDSMNAA